MLPLMRTNVKFEEKTLKGFAGINVGEDCVAGELKFSENISSVRYPSLSSRKPRTAVCETERIINGTGSFEGYVYTSHTADASRIFFTFNGEDYEYTDYSGSKDFTARRKFAALADSILIIPDNVIFSVTNKTFSKVCLSHVQNSTTAKTKFRAEANNSTLLDSQTIDYVAILDHNKLTARSMSYASSGTKTFYYSSFPQMLKAGVVIELKLNVYADSYDDATAYYKYVSKMQSGITLKIKEVISVTHTAPSGSITENIELIFDDNSIDTGGLSRIYVRSFTAARTMPALENICSYGNRIWGVAGKQLYASKLSDAAEWNDFTVDDYGTLPYASFNTAAETDGSFTAIVPFGNYIYAFKENAIHKVYGDSPDEYTVHTEKCRGVGSGMAECLCVCAAGVIYSASDGIYRYRGDYPQKISESIGQVSDVIAAAASEEYYYLLCGSGEEKFLYVYDIRRGIWHSETAPSGSTSLCSYAGLVYLADEGVLWCLNPTEESERGEDAVKWHFTMRIDDKLFGKKGYGRLALRYSLGADSSFTVKARYDDGGEGAVCGARSDEADAAGATLFLPIKRCLWFELEFSGTGKFMLKSMNLKFYRGSEI